MRRPLNAPPAVPSPCTSVCRMDERTGWCEGCRRDLHEIAAWSSMDDDGKRAVWRLIEQRRAEAGDRPGPKRP